MLLILAQPFKALCEEAEFGTDDVVDHRSSETTSGNKTPIDWFEPPIPDPDKVDPNEYRDYLGTTDSPYAFLKVPMPITIGDKTLNPGFYLVKFDMPQGVPQKPRKVFFFKAHRQFYPPVYPTVVADPQGQPVAQLMIKQAGEIITSMPIASVETFPPPPKPKWYQFGKRFKQEVAEPPSPQAALVPVSPDPLQSSAVQIVYCHQSICYRSIPVSSGLVR